ncbi:Dnaj-like protein subfamily b member 8-like protein [Mycena venus]|uniref:Dnaj-like protein subfamily b member 8-like protein n=1 Tax=Mycena venus TaxID=2733690 RepID=A0A8H6YD95_9AGAR|nr:Dnaj-like protein subfamily b member 8-like protein [Mycena venus]
MDSNPPANAPSLYEILGVDRSASADEIRRCYRAKILEVHPDKLDPGASPEDKQASEAKFHEVHEAFEVLRDAYKRRAYDIQRGFRPQSNSKWEGEISEEQRRRMEDRQQWAHKQREQFEERIRNLRARAAADREERKRREQEAAEYRVMVERMLAELYRKNPEWAERREKLRRRGHSNTRPTPTVSS